MARQSVWRVGELAEQAGISVRALHHYDEIGLLAPSRRSDAGYRLYTPDDIARLQQIRLLQGLGFSLSEIKDLLDRDRVSPRRVIGLRIERLEAQIELERRLCRRLEAIGERLANDEEIPTEDFIQTMEMMSMTEKAKSYYSDEQLAYLEERGRQVGEERIREVEAEWPELIAEIRAEMEGDTAPTDERVRALGRRWQALVEEFTGGDPGIAASLQRMYEQEPQVRERAGVDPEVFAYISKAIAAEG